MHKKSGTFAERHGGGGPGGMATNSGDQRASCSCSETTVKHLERLLQFSWSGVCEADQVPADAGTSFERIPRGSKESRNGGVWAAAAGRGTGTVGRQKKMRHARNGAGSGIARLRDTRSFGAAFERTVLSLQTQARPALETIPRDSSAAETLCDSGRSQD